MTRMFNKNDVERLRRTLGVPYEEADALLRRAGGDPEKARRLYISENSVVVEPDRVEDGPRSAFEEARETLAGILKTVFSARIRIVREGDLVAAVPLIIAMLAMLAAPHLTFGSVAVMLFLGCRFTVSSRPRVRIVL